jgi:CheY-like chemotaxis protein
MTVTPHRILIVDDHPIFRETLAQWLRARGHEVAIAETGLAAFLALRIEAVPSVGFTRVPFSPV